ncbi:hypothetical protein DPMN_053092 [Dreissena polymorpha]|uniref:RING-type domain-containing protein n=1 Tax=Dreissena polymorpha TaxID=45954 RepID=A0A9D4HQE4_DREPO|nr:hypothetical protein DPMN_053092 [Dreissena polymorpha]
MGSINRDLITENARLKDCVCCSRCRVSYKNVLFVPCCHLLMCMRCSARFRVCPECNTNIEDRIIAILTPLIETIYSENARLKSELYCNQCKVQKTDALFFPCHHHLLCMSCAKNLNICIACKTKIDSVKQTIMP